MPDLVTHLASGYVASVPIWDRKLARLVLCSGVILPDLLTRPANILLPAWRDWFAPLHTPFGFAVFSLMAAQLFVTRKDRLVAFWALLAGGGLHFTLDALQRHVVPEYYWLFPFSWWSYCGGLFWPEDPLWFVPLAGLLIVALEIKLRQLSKPRHGNTKSTQL